MRLFAGIAIGPNVVANLARILKELRPLAPLTWSPVENLHITSKFIGEWPEERLLELEEALEGVPLPGSFTVTISGFGYFPNPHNPRVLFAGVQAGSELGALAAAIDERLRLLGIAGEERPYSPHLTLAQIKQKPAKPDHIRELREHIANMTNFDFGTFQDSEFHLYLSKTGPKGSVYTSLASYPLTPAAGSQTSIEQ